MVIGKGLIATTFKEYDDDANVVIFASGVSNSSETLTQNFKKEETLLKETILNNNDKFIIYFSSCGLINNDYLKIPYYKHKKLMENLIKQYSKKYLIIRLPQVFGTPKVHPTLINYLYNKIDTNEKFQVLDKAYRYIIHKDDILRIVTSFIKKDIYNKTINVANSYKYSIYEIIECIETKLNKVALYSTVDVVDDYDLDLDFMDNFINKYDINIFFGKNYLCNKLEQKVGRIC